jgi:hypothetical protein
MQSSPLPCYLIPLDLNVTRCEFSTREIERYDDVKISLAGENGFK